MHAGIVCLAGLSCTIQKKQLQKSTAVNLPKDRKAEETLRTCANRVREILDADGVFLYLSDMEEGQTCNLAALSDGAQEIVPAGKMIRLRGPLETVWNEGKSFTADAEAFSYLPSLEMDNWAVLRLGFQFIPFGLLFVVRRGREPNSVSEIEEAGAYLEGSLHALHEAWIGWLVHRRSATLQSLVDVSTSLASSLDRETVLGQVVQQTGVLLTAKLCSLMLLDNEKEELVLESAYGCSIEYLEKPNLPVSDSLLGRVVKQSEIVRIDDVRTDSKYLHRDLARREGLCSLMAAPVRFAGKTLGVLSIYSAIPHEWTEKEEVLLHGLASSAAVAIQNAFLVEKIGEIERKAAQTSRLSILGELTASLAHQIRNPLAVVNMLIHSWQPSSLPAQLQDDLRVIMDNIVVLNRIVEGALTLARQQPPQPKACDVAEIVNGLYLVLRHQMRERHITFQNEIRPDFPHFFADRDQVEQALLSLIVNAIEAVPDQGEIGIQASRTREMTTIEVWDNGPGVSPEIRDSLFEAFKSTKPGGLGLGLSIVSRIVRDHGGQVSVREREAPDGGTVFALQFPHRSMG